MTGKTPHRTESNPFGSGMPRREKPQRGRGIRQRRRRPSREAPHRTESNPFGSGLPQRETRRGRGIRQRRRGPSREAPHRTESNPFGSETSQKENPACDRLSPTRAGLPSRNITAHREQPLRKRDTPAGKTRAGKESPTRDRVYGWRESQALEHGEGEPETRPPGRAWLCFFRTDSFPLLVRRGGFVIR